jgi:phage repressor protein C with HTH and peptisase S24 domain
MADPVEGTREVTLAGAGGSDKDFDSNRFSLEGTYGYYRSPEVLLGIRQSVRRIQGRRRKLPTGPVPHEAL